MKPDELAQKSSIKSNGNIAPDTVLLLAKPASQTGKSKWFFPILFIGGFFVVIFLLIAFWVHAQNKKNYLANFVSSDVMLYAQIKDSFIKNSIYEDKDPFLQELYTFANKSLGSDLAIEKDIVPNVYKEGALFVVNDGGIKPIFLIRTKNPNRIEKKFKNSMEIEPDIIAFSNQDINLKKYIGFFPKTIAKQLLQYGNAYSYIKIFINLENLNLFPKNISNTLITLDKDEQWRTKIYFPKDIVKKDYVSRSHFTDSIFPKQDDFLVFLHNIPAKNALDAMGTESLFSSERVKSYIINEILPMISQNIDFGFTESSKNNENSYFIILNLLESDKEDDFIQKIRTMLAYFSPEYNEKTLIDGTIVYEEVLRPEKFSFSLIKKNKGIYSFTQNQKEYWYYQSNGKKILLSNNLEYIYHYMEEKDMEKRKNCLSSDSEKYIIIQSEFIKKYFSAFDNWEFSDRSLYFDFSKSDRWNGCII